jgi:hypothetical protein
VPGLFSRVQPRFLEYREIFQQRDDADDDDNDPRDLFGAAIERQHVDQIEHQNNNEKCDQNTDKCGHCFAPFVREARWPVAYRLELPDRAKVPGEGPLQIRTASKPNLTPPGDVTHSSETTETHNQRLGNQVAQFFGKSPLI